MLGFFVCGVVFLFGFFFILVSPELSQLFLKPRLWGRTAPWFVPQPGFGALVFVGAVLGGEAAPQGSQGTAEDLSQSLQGHQWEGGSPQEWHVFKAEDE